MKLETGLNNPELELSQEKIVALSSRRKHLQTQVSAVSQIMASSQKLLKGTLTDSRGKQVTSDSITLPSRKLENGKEEKRMLTVHNQRGILTYHLSRTRKGESQEVLQEVFIQELMKEYAQELSQVEDELLEMHKGYVINITQKKTLEDNLEEIQRLKLEDEKMISQLEERVDALTIDPSTLGLSQTLKDVILGGQSWTAVPVRILRNFAFVCFTLIISQGTLIYLLLVNSLPEWLTKLLPIT